MDDYEVVAFGSPPASAGSTEVVSMSPASVWDHPRERGEHMARQYVDVERLAITPASAGSTLRRAPRTHISSDHPRERGEHGTALSPTHFYEGSPPRARGAHTLARAARGPGSPPRARGARLVPDRLYPVVGITPASAGSTFPHRSVRALARDHPRERGEHEAGLCRPAWLIGSPPRARGARMPPRMGKRRFGITPASAGSTRPPRRRRAPGPDHPRERGEHSY